MTPDPYLRPRVANSSSPPPQPHQPTLAVTSSGDANRNISISNFNFASDDHRDVLHSPPAFASALSDAEDAEMRFERELADTEMVQYFAFDALDPSSPFLTNSSPIPAVAVIDTSSPSLLHRRQATWTARRLLFPTPTPTLGLGPLRLRRGRRARSPSQTRIFPRVPHHYTRLRLTSLRSLLVLACLALLRPSEAMAGVEACCSRVRMVMGTTTAWEELTLMRSSTQMDVQTQLTWAWGSAPTPRASNRPLYISITCR